MTPPALFRCAALAMLALIASLCPVHARDLTQTADPPGFWRTMTPDGSNDTSPCLGSVETPICAVETFYAGFEKHLGTFSERAYPGFTVPLFPEYRSMENYKKYKITRVHHMNGNEQGFVSLPHVPGDIAVGCLLQTCNVKSTNCYNSPENEQVFVLREFSDGWKIIRRFIDRGGPMLIDVLAPENN